MIEENITNFESLDNDRNATLLHGDRYIHLRQHTFAPTIDQCVRRKSRML